MRKYNFDEYIKNKPDFVRTALNLVYNAGHSKKTSAKPRSRAEEKFLIKLDIERWARWQKEGKLEFLGGRKFRFMGSSL